MLDVSSLPPDTAALLLELAARPDLNGFTLIGGTALALRHGHRMSEDIDLACSYGRLPRGRVDALLRDLAEWHDVRDAMSQMQRVEWEESGLELADYHQDWSVGGVKLTFFAPDGEQAGLIAKSRPDRFERLAVADDELLFALKSRVLYVRTASRDLFDIWYFVDRQERSVGDVVGELAAGYPHVGPDALLARLTPTKFPAADPGFDTQLKGAPATREELLERMRELVDRHKRSIARDIALAAMQDQER